MAVLGQILVPLRPGPTAETSRARRAIEEIRQELPRLPQYGVFDFVTFSYHEGKVTLQGYAYEGRLKTEADRAVKRVRGVVQVLDNIEVLPSLLTDDELRWRTYDAIYGDPFLSHYAPGGRGRQASQSEFRRFELEGFPGTEPTGNYPIHIIIKDLHVTLLGVVDDDADRDLAGIKADDTPGSVGVDNELRVEPLKQSTRG